MICGLCVTPSLKPHLLASVPFCEQAKHALPSELLNLLLALTGIPYFWVYSFTFLKFPRTHRLTEEAFLDHTMQNYTSVN